MEYKLQENILVNDSCCLHYVGSASRNLFYFTCSCLTSKTPFIVPLNSAVIDTVIGTKVSTFFQVDPVIRTKDGQLLEVYINQKKLIPLDEVPSRMSSTACQKKYIEKIEESAGKLSSCQEIQPLGEWCPAPYTVFAATLNGELWMFQKHQVCIFAVIMLSMMGGLLDYLLAS